MPSYSGIDTTSNITNLASTIYASGYRFAIRYYSLPANSKRTSLSELTAIGNAGLKRIVVYQNLHNSYSKFNPTIAANDAADALSQAVSYGQPTGSIIYFSVDFDATATQIAGNITSHFQVLSNTINPAGYGVGVYGSGLVCSTLFNNGYVSHTWLAMSTSWAGYNSFSTWNIKQLQATTVAGVACDTDTANSLTSIGGW